MPFGHNCEHANFEACVRTMRGKVQRPSGYCASLMRQTEEMCKQKGMMAAEWPGGAWLDLLGPVRGVLRGLLRSPQS